MMDKTIELKYVQKEVILQQEIYQHFAMHGEMSLKQELQQE
jgi:hypothetical protein